MKRICLVTILGIFLLIPSSIFAKEIESCQTQDINGRVPISDIEGRIVKPDLEKNSYKIKYRHKFRQSRDSRSHYFEKERG
jgi:hypothetical protein